MGPGELPQLLPNPTEKSELIILFSESFSTHANNSVATMRKADRTSPLGKKLPKKRKAHIKECGQSPQIFQSKKVQYPYIM